MTDDHREARRRWCLCADIAWTEAGPGRMAVVAFAVGRPVVLEGSAAVVWARLVEHTAPRFSAEEIAGPLAQQHGIAQERVTEDVLGFFRTLHTEGLISPAEGGAE